MFSRQAARITANIGVLSAATITVVVLSGQVPATSGVTTTLSPVADGYVQDNTPSTNYGASTRFVVGNSPVRRSFLKFTVSGLTQPITNVKPWIRTINGDAGSNNGGVFESAPQLVVTTGTSPSSSPTPPPWSYPVLVGAGDIASSGLGDSATAALLDNIPGTVFTAGDNAYPDGTLPQFNAYYEPTWAGTKPVPDPHPATTTTTPRAPPVTSATSVPALAHPVGATTPTISATGTWCR